MEQEKLFQDRFLLTFESSKIIGEGAFGKVYRGQDLQTGDEIAIKIIPKEKLNSEYLEQCLKKELDILKLCESPYSTRLIGTFEDEINVYIIMELCDSDLDKELKKCGNTFPLERIKKILLQLNKVFFIMNKNNIIHRDLKLENIFIKYTNPQKTEFDVKLGDFGLSTVSLNNIAMSTVGTPYTQAPEILNIEEYTNKADLWSLGVITYQMYFGQLPYKANNTLLLKRQIRTSKPMYRPEEPDFADLLDKLLEKDQYERIEWKDYYMHPFFGGSSDIDVGALNADNKGMWVSVIQTSLDEMKKDFNKKDVVYKFKFEKKMHNINKEMYVCSKVRDANSGKLFLVKTYSENFVRNHDKEFQKEKERFRIFNKYNIPALKYESEQLNDDGSRSMVFQYEKGNVLSNYIENTYINEQRIYHIIVSLVKDIFVPVHKLGIHLDIITLDSILINIENGNVFLFDCGLHKWLYTEEMIEEYFIYPNETVQNEKTNVLNFGVTIFKAFFKTNPILSSDLCEISIPRGTEYTIGLKHFLSSALCNNPNKRADWNSLSEIYINVPLNIVSENKAIITSVMMEHIFQTFDRKVNEIETFINSEKFKALNANYSSHLCLFIFSVISDMFYARKMFIDFYEEKQNMSSIMNVFQFQNNTIQAECIDFSNIPLNKMIYIEQVFNSIHILSETLQENRYALLKIFKSLVTQANLPYLEMNVSYMIFEILELLKNNSMHEYIQEIIKDSNEYDLFAKYLVEFVISFCYLACDQSKVLKQAAYEINNMFIEGPYRSDVLWVGEMEKEMNYQDIVQSCTFTSFWKQGFVKCKDNAKYQIIFNDFKRRFNNFNEVFIGLYRDVNNKMKKD